MGVVVCLARHSSFRFDFSYGIGEDQTIVIVVARQTGLDANVASKTKWVLDIRLTFLVVLEGEIRIGSFQSRNQSHLFLSHRVPVDSWLREDISRLFRQMWCRTLSS